MKIVADTSFLIAAFYRPLHRPSFSREVYDYLVNQEEVYISPYILKEFREKCLKKLGFPAADVNAYEALLKKKAQVVSPRPVRWVLPQDMTLRDAKDAPIIDLAVSIGADLLISWDKDLLALKTVDKIRIVNPKEFWGRLR